MSPDDLLLRRNPPRTAPALTLWDEIVLMLARVHEICGSSRRTLALQVAARIGAPVFWIAPTWGADPLNTDGVAPICPPQALTFLAPKRPEDILWCMEETLRAGCVPLVVADLPEPPGLTPVRRLHLAAEAGAGHGRCRPLGLLLTPWDGGAPGVETRLRCDPDHGPGRTAWSITRLRARMAPQKAWTLEDDRLAPAPLQEIRPPGETFRADPHTGSADRTIAPARAGHQIFPARERKG